MKMMTEWWMIVCTVKKDEQDQLSYQIKNEIKVSIIKLIICINRLETFKMMNLMCIWHSIYHELVQIIKMISRWTERNYNGIIKRKRAYGFPVRRWRYHNFQPPTIHIFLLLLSAKMLKLKMPIVDSQTKLKYVQPFWRHGEVLPE